MERISRLTPISLPKETWRSLPDTLSEADRRRNFDQFLESFGNTPSGKAALERTRDRLETQFQRFGVDHA